MYLNVYLIVNIWTINCESPRRSLSFFIPSLLQPAFAAARGRARPVPWIPTACDHAWGGKDERTGERDATCLKSTQYVVYVYCIRDSHVRGNVADVAARPVDEEAAHLHEQAVSVVKLQVEPEAAV